MRRSTKVLLTAGLLLMAVGVGLLTADVIRTAVYRDRAADTAAQMEAALPPASAGIPAEGAEMPVWQWEGQDMVALLNIPAYDVKLPVGATWGKTAAYPRLFSGSVHDGDLVIGGADRAGQLDCLDVIGDGTVVTVTDMSGAVYSYTVSQVERSRTADAAVIVEDGYDLTLFVRDTYSLEHILVRCTRT